jgi:hypothetical protein
MIPQFLIARFGPLGAKLVFFGTIVAILLLIVGGIYLAGHSAGKSGEVVKEQARTIDTIQKVGDANTNASAARVDDTRRQDQQKQELNDALKNASGGDDARRRTGCAILRQQGRDVSAIPACR